MTASWRISGLWRHIGEIVAGGRKITRRKKCLASAYQQLAAGVYWRKLTS